MGLSYFVMGEVVLRVVMAGTDSWLFTSGGAARINVSFSMLFFDKVNSLMVVTRTNSDRRVN
jgi:hypothetical protein